MAQRSRSLTSQLYRAARVSNTIGTAASGHPKRIATRGKNIVVGRTFAKAGIWRRLWR
jgi:hypothetical protein